MSSQSTLVPKVLENSNSSPIGRQGGYLCTYNRITSQCFWIGMKKAIKQYIDESKTNLIRLSQQIYYNHCQFYETPERISMDFIQALPRSAGFDTIWLVVDKLSLCGHFNSVEVSIPCGGHGRDIHERSNMSP